MAERSNRTRPTQRNLSRLSKEEMNQLGKKYPVKMRSSTNDGIGSLGRMSNEEYNREFSRTHCPIIYHRGLRKNAVDKK